MDPQNPQHTMPPVAPATPVPPSTPTADSSGVSPEFSSDGGRMDSSEVNNAPQKPSPLTTIAFVLLGVAVLAVAVYFVGTFATNKKVIISSPTPIATPSSTSTTPPSSSGSDSEQIKKLVEDYLVLRGHKRDSLVIDDPILLGDHKDKYSVGFKLRLDTSSHGGTYLLIGKINGDWVIPESGDSNYCNWLVTAGLDESTKAFMGPTCKF